MTRLNNLLLPAPIWILILLVAMQNSAKGIAKTETEEKQNQGLVMGSSYKNDDPNPKPLWKNFFASIESENNRNNAEQDDHETSDDQNKSGESSRQEQKKGKRENSKKTEPRPTVFDLFGIPNPYKNNRKAEEGESSKSTVP